MSAAPKLDLRWIVRLPGWFRIISEIRSSGRRGGTEFWAASIFSNLGLIRLFEGEERNRLLRAYSTNK